VRSSGSELANAKDLQGAQPADKDTVFRTDQTHVIGTDSAEAESQSVNNDLHVAQAELYDILSANQLLNRRIWMAEDLLLNVYETASVHLEEVLLIILY